MINLSTYVQGLEERTSKYLQFENWVRYAVINYKGIMLEMLCCEEPPGRLNAQ
jgi:hypothetical protein